MNRIKVVFAGISEIVGGNSMGLVKLTDEAGGRVMSVVCDAMMKMQIALRRSSKAGIRGKMLPEVMANVVGDITGWSDFEVYIYGIVDGEYKTVLHNNAAMTEYPMRVSDAILLSIISGVPIFVSEALFLEQSIPNIEGADRVAVPINAITTERLEEVLRRAVDAEDYRLAAQIKEELKKRQ